MRIRDMLLEGQAPILQRYWQIINRTEEGSTERMDALRYYKPMVEKYIQRTWKKAAPDAAAVECLLWGSSVKRDHIIMDVEGIDSNSRCELAIYKHIVALRFAGNAKAYFFYYNRDESFEDFVSKSIKLSNEVANRNEY